MRNLAKTANNTIVGEEISNIDTNEGDMMTDIDLFSVIDSQIADANDTIEHCNKLKQKLKSKQMTIATQYYQRTNGTIDIYVYYCERGEPCSYIYRTSRKVAPCNIESEYAKFVEELKTIYPKVKVL